MSQIIERVKYVHPHGSPVRGNILMIASSPTVSAQTNWPIGFWAAEMCHPLWEFQEAGFQVDIFSTEGGKLEMDAYSNPLDPSGYSANDIISLGYLQQASFQNMIRDTKKFTEADINTYDAIFLVGGQGPMYTFKGNTSLQELFVSFYEAGKPSATVCHATTLLLEAKKTDGDLLVSGKTWTGFTNAEEEYADQAAGIKIQPYWIEEEAKKLSHTHFKTAPPFIAHAISDGNLITGQQQNSGAAAAELVISQLSQ